MHAGSLKIKSVLLLSMEMFRKLCLASWENIWRNIVGLKLVTCYLTFLSIRVTQKALYHG